ncbi:MAG: cytochrome c, partial [Acidobacteriaceae bacterium]|nr:cytochrome c [Acidobacteriaceae bacterium]
MVIRKMQLKNLLLIPLAVAVIATPLISQERRDAAGDAGRKFLAIGEAPDPAAVERGEKLYVPNCGFCHGSRANGGQSGPDLVRSVLVLHDVKGDKIGPVILQGRPDKGMPKFNFTKEQIQDVSAFLLSRSQGAANRMAYKILDINTGDAAAGKTFFNGAGQCNECHSPTGDLAGIATKMDAVTLESRFLYPRTHSMGAPPAGAKNAPVLATVTLPSGKVIEGSLIH